MKFTNATQAFEALYDKIMDEGEDYAGTKALFNQSFTIENSSEKVITTPWRKFNNDYAAYEWDWYLKGDRDATEIAKRAKMWEQMFVEGTTEINSNYGWFWNYNNQLSRVIEELRERPQSRRAIVIHYHLDELDRYKYDTPCNDALNFYIQNGKLHLTVFARSIDCVYGFCNDQYTFANLMEYVGKDLGIEIGQMHWFITNMHIYPKHYKMKNK